MERSVLSQSLGRFPFLFQRTGKKSGLLYGVEERVEKGDDDAMWMLGACYEFGIGIEKDVAEAKALYSRSKQERNDFSVFLANKAMNEIGNEELVISACL